MSKAKQYITIVRCSQQKYSVLGLLLGFGLPFPTLELPWRDNLPQVSCIPAGVYDCKVRPCSLGISAGLGLAIEVLGVPGRSDILIHVGNTPKDIQGCVLVGERFGEDPNYGTIVVSSRVAYRRIMKDIKEGDEFLLTVIDSWKSI